MKKAQIIFYNLITYIFLLCCFFPVFVVISDYNKLCGFLVVYLVFLIHDEIEIDTKKDFKC